MRRDKLNLAAADSRVDQEDAFLQAWAAEDVGRWARLARMIKEPTGRYTEEDMLMILRLASFGAVVITGRLLDRKV